MKTCRTEMEKKNRVCYLPAARSKEQQIVLFFGYQHRDSTVLVFSSTKAK